jgi:DNA polymerase III epsilon subunit-like protein
MNVMKQNLVFLDTETTGIENGRLIQLAYKKQNNVLGDDNGNKEKTVVEYFKPPVPIEIEAMAIHHITEKHIAAKPAFAKSKAFDALQKLLADPATILVAHNAKFDIGILEREGVAIDHNRFICTMKVAQTMYDLPQYKMQYLRYLWGIEDDEAIAHDAAGDVAILEKVFDYLATDYAAKHPGEDAVEAFINISKNPVLLRRASFGKYAGKTFEEIKTVDVGYLQWMSSLADKDEDFLYTVNYYLNGSEGGTRK